MDGNLIFLKELKTECPYIKNKKFTSENVFVESVSAEDLCTLLQKGYRHFGKYFFRPICKNCHRCIPLRIPVEGYKISKSAKKLINQNKEIQITLNEPAPDRESFNLYCRHKEKFDRPVQEQYADYIRSFFAPLAFNKQITMTYKDKIICISHIDITKELISAVYCYYDTSMDKASLGTYAIIQELIIAKQLGVPYLYLGYYIEESPHMRYKKRFRPNQALIKEGNWIDFIDKDGNFLDSKGMKKGFQPKKKLIEYCASAV